jgi:NAD(P)-dependent dehydrogenase (short-subunit alcohol dehydrogenase family)
MRLFDLTGKVAVVTGGGRGLGRAMAIGLAEAGAQVVVAGRTAADLEESVAMIAEQGRSARAVTFDALSRTDCRRLFEQAVTMFGGLDIAVVNHGIGRGKPAIDVTDQDLTEMIDINLKSAFVCAQEAARRMIAEGRGGSIIFISSTGSMVAFDQLATYGAAKGGVDQVCRQFALEFAPHNIRVNSINPGYMTHFMRGSAPRYDTEEVTERIRMMTPMARSGRPEELVGPVIFLASEASSFITGHIMPVDGGYVAL